MKEAVSTQQLKHSVSLDYSEPSSRKQDTRVKRGGG
jgi:hypothetical protein